MRFFKIVLLGLLALAISTNSFAEAFGGASINSTGARSFARPTESAMMLPLFGMRPGGTVNRAAVRVIRQRPRVLSFFRSSGLLIGLTVALFVGFSQHASGALYSRVSADGFSKTKVGGVNDPNHPERDRVETEVGSTLGTIVEAVYGPQQTPLQRRLHFQAMKELNDFPSGVHPHTKLHAGLVLRVPPAHANSGAPTHASAASVQGNLPSESRGAAWLGAPVRRPVIQTQPARRREAEPRTPAGPGSVNAARPETGADRTPPWLTVALDLRHAIEQRWMLISLWVASLALLSVLYFSAVRRSRHVAMPSVPLYIPRLVATVPGANGTAKTMPAVRESAPDAPQPTNGTTRPASREDTPVGLTASADNPLPPTLTLLTEQRRETAAPSPSPEPVNGKASRAAEVPRSRRFVDLFSPQTTTARGTAKERLRALSSRASPAALDEPVIQTPAPKAPKSYRFAYPFVRRTQTARETAKERLRTLSSRASPAPFAETSVPAAPTVTRPALLKPVPSLRKGWTSLREWIGDRLILLRKPASTLPWHVRLVRWLTGRPLGGHMHEWANQGYQLPMYPGFPKVLGASA